MADAGELYDRDFLRWTEQQATALRHAAKDSNLPLDWENLAEEIESLGKSQRRELSFPTPADSSTSAQARSLSRPIRPRAGWRGTITDARADIEDVLRASPSLRREVAAI